MQTLEAESLHFQGLYNRLRNALITKDVAQIALNEALQQCIKQQDFKPNKKASLRQTSILDNHEEQEQ